MYRYTKDDPKWVQATKVVGAGDEHVTVTAYGETWTVTPGWSNLFMDKTKSDALVQNSRGDWLKVWWNDSDVERESK
jgi:hypothetical protein